MPFTKENENGNSQSGICGDNLTWTLDGGTLTIRGTGKMYNYVYTRRYWTANVSPAEIESECHSTPWDCQKDTITKAVIENGVTSIGEGAFWCCGNLTSVTIPNSVTSIEDWVFHDCASLTTVTIPDSVTSIGEGTFSGCASLTSIAIPNGVICIEWDAFSGCDKLTSITIPAGVTAIGYKAFFDCTSLKDVYYSGTKEDCTKMKIGYDNSGLMDAVWHYKK